MSRSNRSGRAAIALAIWCQACSVHRPAPADLSLLQGARVRVRSTAPFALSGPADANAAVTLCSATAVEGRVRSVMGDTLALERVSGIVTAPEADGSNRACPRRESVSFVRTPATEMTLRETDKGRTTLLLLGIAAALVAFAALAASQMQFGFPQGTGTYGIGP